MRILVVKLSSLGDLFHALPAVTHIQQAWNAEVDWVTNTAYVDLVRAFGPVCRVIGFPRKNFAAGALRLWREVRREKYDFVFDMQGLMKSALVTGAARADRRIGPSFHREGSRFFYDAVTGPRNKERHAVEENLDLVEFLAMERGVLEFPVRWTLPPHLPPGAKIGLLPCSRWPTKNWPVEHFVALIKELAGEANLYLFGAPEDADACAQIDAGSGGAAKNLCGQTSLLELGGWLAGMDLVITVDSGPMHMAAATGTPVLALFGPTDPKRTGPYGSMHRVLQRDDLSCRPCLSRACLLPEADTRCMSGLAPDRVARVAREMLAETG